MHHTVEFTPLVMDHLLTPAFPLLEKEGDTCFNTLISQRPKPIGIDRTIVLPVLTPGDHPIKSIDVIAQIDLAQEWLHTEKANYCRN